MKSKTFESMDDYIAAQPEDMQRALSRVRATIAKAVPEAVETISYSMPAFKLHGRVLLYFAGWAEHYAIYPGSADALSELKAELAPYKVSKGTIRFECADAVPVALVKRIAAIRARELEQQKAVKRAKRA
jgi:uncharacterized protein YdhG (YjbR/CyaY superfamily)